MSVLPECLARRLRREGDNSMSAADAVMNDPFYVALIVDQEPSLAYALAEAVPRYKFSHASIPRVSLFQYAEPITWPSPPVPWREFIGYSRENEHRSIEAHLFMSMPYELTGATFRGSTPSNAFEKAAIGLVCARAFNMDKPERFCTYVSIHHRGFFGLGDTVVDLGSVLVERDEMRRELDRFAQQWHIRMPRNPRWHATRDRVLGFLYDAYAEFGDNPPGATCPELIDV